MASAGFSSGAGLGVGAGAGAGGSVSKDFTNGTSAASGGKCLLSSNGDGSLGMGAGTSTPGIPSTTTTSPSSVTTVVTAPATTATDSAILGGDGSRGGGVGGLGRRYVQMGSIPSIRSTKVKSRSSPISAKCSFAMINSSAW